MWDPRPCGGGASNLTLSHAGGDPEEEQAIFVPFSHTDGDWDGGEDYSPKQASTNPNSKASIEGA